MKLTLNEYVKKHGARKTAKALIDKRVLERTKELQIRKARSIYYSRPFVNQMWMAMQGFPYQFICDNWNEITSQPKK